jgi:hypothetical protein
MLRVRSNCFSNEFTRPIGYSFLLFRYGKIKEETGESDEQGREGGTVP